MKYDIIIIGGFGHVGLPLGLVLADAGLRVGLYDIDHSKRASIEAGVMPFLEHDAEPLLKKVIGKSLRVVEAISEVANADVVLVTIGTPIDEHLNPQMDPILRLAEELSLHLSTGQCLILRSTVYPGTGKWLADFFTAKGLKLHIAYCPERIVQGFAIRELRTLPQIISGFSAEAVACSQQIFNRIGAKTIEVTVQEAEFAKLFANAWRYVQFAIANQFYTMATAAGANYDRIHHALTADYERAKDFPKPGFAAGPCLLKDTMQLAAFHGANFQLGHAAMVVNEGLPNFIVNHLKSAYRADLNKACVGILGMAFKANTDDIRDSLSFKLAKILRFNGAQVLCSDEYVEDSGFVSKDELLSKASIIIVGVPHTPYRGLNIPGDKVLIDLWGVTCRRGQ